MGFFSSRKTEDNSNYLATAAADDKSVVHVIRSRFVRFFIFSLTPLALAKPLNGFILRAVRQE